MNSMSWRNSCEFLINQFLHVKPTTLPGSLLLTGIFLVRQLLIQLDMRPLFDITIKLDRNSFQPTNLRVMQMGDMDIPFPSIFMDQRAYLDTIDWPKMRRVPINPKTISTQIIDLLLDGEINNKKIICNYYYYY